MSSETETDTRQEEVAAKLESVLAADGCVADVMGLDPADLEVLYNFAYTEHQQGKYADAATTFTYLCQCDHRQARFWMGLGACHQMSGNYEGAVLAYTQASECDPPDPKAPLHAAECLLTLGFIEDSLAALDFAVDLADYSEDRKVILDQIGMLYNAIELFVDQIDAELAAEEAEAESGANAETADAVRS
ncbi:MAG: SycD/LcrH family type III secretion system chaperone [Planctomycetota bacterium]